MIIEDSQLSNQVGVTLAVIGYRERCQGSEARE